jgi:serine/threonine-protein kinase
MADASDTLFIEMAVAKGYLDRERAEEALHIQEATKDDGEHMRVLRRIVVSEGWMTEDQVTEVAAQIDEGSEKTGKIEGYTLLSKIGQGGMGAVYRARREATGETVALKVLPGRMARRSDFVERFLREARAASKIQSDHIVRAVDVGFSGGYYYFAMEFVEGESVDTTLSIDGPMAESKVLHIIHQMALALRDAEEAGLVHRDIKPGNIIVTEDGVAKLTDFGLAREISDDSITQTGVTLGTPNYMSPEQARAMKSLDVRSDIYSLGVTFYHMATGTVPFHGETSLLTMLKHLNEEPVAPMTRRPDLSRACNDVILKMLKKDRDERYRRADELVADLERVMNGKEPKYAQSTEPAPEAEGEEGEQVPEELERFAQEIRKQGRVRWIKVATVLFGLALFAVVVYAVFIAPGEPGPGEGNGGTSSENGPVAPTKRERLARETLDAAKDFAARNPERHVPVWRRFEQVANEYRASQVYDEARRLRDEARKTLEAEVDKALAACRTRAEELAKVNRFGDAKAAYDAFPEPLEIPDAVQRIDAARRDLDQRAQAKYEELRRRAEVYIENGKLSAARKTVEPALTFGLSGVVARAKKLLARIDYEAMTADTRKDSEAIEAYQAAIAKVRSHVRAGRFDRAQAQLEVERRSARHELARKMLAETRPTLVLARGVWAAITKGVRSVKPGFEIQMGSTTARLVKYDATSDKLLFRLRGGRRLRLSCGWLPPEALRQLALAGADGDVPPLSLGAFYLARGEYPQAAKYLQEARAADPDSKVLSRYERQLSMLQKTRQEVEAENLLDKAKEQAAAEGAIPQQVARTLWELVNHYTDTRYYERHRQEIEALLAQAEAESITVDTLFAVTPTELPDGRSELRYDFADRAQGRDWLTLWQGRSYGRWSIRPEFGGLTAESGFVYFKVPLRGDYEVELKTRDVRQASIRFGMSAPSASPRATGCSFTWKRVGDGAESALEKAGKALARPRKVPRFHVVGALQLGLQAKGGAITVTVNERVVHRVSATAKALDPEEPGYLVFDRFTAGARVSSVTIRCGWDREWLETNFVEPLRKAKLAEARWRMARYQPLLEEDDESAWRPFSPGGAPQGKWTFARGYAMAPERATCAMTRGDMNWRDYAFTAKVRTGTTTGAAWLMVRWTDASAAGGAGQGYYVELAAGRGSAGSGGRITLGKTAGGRKETLESVGANITSFDWYPVYVEVRGPRLRVLLGGREVLNAEDKTYAAGRVGLASFRCGAHFHDVKIKLMK